MTKNIYWTEVTDSGSGKIVVAKNDARYMKTIVSARLQMPTSIALDPEKGLMFWTDAGLDPKIEVAWMDGSQRKTLVSDKIDTPMGLTIDYYMDHTLYWVDSKLNTINTMAQDGSRRRIVAQGRYLTQPVSIDVFESHMYWAAGDSKVIPSQGHKVWRDNVKQIFLIYGSYKHNS